MKKGEKTRQDLLQIAYRLFLEKGYENTSVDTIIAEAKIAKGTYYYHFQSKEQMLEAVIGMMLEGYEERAYEVLGAELPLEEKMLGIVAAFRPSDNESTIVSTLNKQENLIMHDRINREMIERIVPMLSAVVVEGTQSGVFNCDDIPQRVRTIMILSSNLFDDGDFSEADVRVFIDTVEKILGAAPGTMSVLNSIISGGQRQ